jgi:hypothetical protein
MLCIWALVRRVLRFRLVVSTSHTDRAVTGPISGSTANKFVIGTSSVAYSGRFLEERSLKTSMPALRFTCLSVLTSVVICVSSAMGQNASPAVRIVNPIDEKQLATLRGTVHPLANAKNDRGAAPDSAPLERIHLMLKRSASQQAALDQLVAGLAGMGCGGGNGGGGSGNGGGGGGGGNTGTTAGAYTVTVTGTSGSASQMTTVTLTVN